MAFRSDVSVDWESSPRIITVASPSTEITIQDLHDTCRDLESRLENLDDDILITSAGKEDLGGGVSVGITATLLNALLAFQDRPSPTYVQCRVAGGNLVALDANGLTQSTPIQPTAFTQVVVTASSSATSQNQEDIQFASYANNSVWLDPSSGFSGTDNPTGTSRQPVNNDIDAQTIADNVGVYNITIRGNTTFTGTHSLMKFWGRSPRTTQLTIDATANLTGCEFQAMLLSGDLGSNGSSYYTAVALKDVTGIFGHLENCVLREGTNTLVAPNGFAMLNKCAAVSAINPGTDIPIFDLNGSGRLAARSLDGEIIFRNKSSGGDCSLHLNGCVVTLDSTITQGTWRFHGVGTVIDNSVGATIDTTDLVSPQSVADSVWDETLADHTATGSTGEALSTGGSGGGLTPTQADTLDRIDSNTQLDLYTSI